MAAEISPTRGRFITVEGGEGAGKSTQVELLLKALSGIGINAQCTREPGGSDGAEAIRALLLEGATDRWDAIGEALLLNAARRDHVFRQIKPALDGGAWVICDRFADSTLAYQGYGRGLPRANLQALHRLAIGDFVPDLTLILDLPVAEGLARAARRSGTGDRFERLGRDFHERMRQGFLSIAAENPDRCVVIDAVGTRDLVHHAVLAVVSERLGIGFSR
ncbi:MAG TPA: dTMP kinase [Stellaceae bacterium]|jgi:dTMP kinase|nr:dTMP kinase [Stellaceae bacterium]